MIAQVVLGNRLRFFVVSLTVLLPPPANFPNIFVKCSLQFFPDFV